ncbi:MAG: right-handed parallel beta-helix repeat-containing protein [Solirubrobacterales bacterium]|nr:right-handed parallel beta-helix repeat-containing protein [Solirubrobacterales bacterium]
MLLSPRLLAAVAALAVLPASASAAETITVDSTADLVDVAPADGACQAANGKCTLRAALQTANMDPGDDRDTIVLPEGTFKLAPAVPDDGDDFHDTDKAAAGDWDVTEDVVLEGAGPGRTILDGQRLPKDPVLEVSRVGTTVADPYPAAVEISGLTIQGGADGGLENVDGLVLRHAVLRDNVGQSALYSEAEHDVVVEDVEVTDNGRLDSAAEPNIASDGAGVEHSGSGCMTLRRVLVARNKGETGGGVAFWNGPADVIDSSILDNVARDDRLPGNSEEAGGIVQGNGGGAAGRVRISGSTIAGNSADGDGGGILVWSWSELEMENSTISGNTSDDRTGALGVAGGNAKARLRNVTVAGNTSKSAQVEWYANGRQPGDEIVLQASIVSGSGPACAAGLTSLGANVVSGTACGFAGPLDVQDADALLGPLGDHGGPTPTRVPAAASPAVDLGAPCLPVDQRGVARPVAGACDAGAVEVGRTTGGGGEQPGGEQPGGEQPPPTTPATPVTPATAPVTAAGPPAAALPAFAQVVQLPSARRCVSRRSFRIRLRIPRGVAVSSATVLVDGRRVKVVKGRRLTAPVDLRGLPKGRFTVKITLATADGRTIAGSRTYRTCAKKVKARRRTGP